MLPNAEFGRTHLERLKLAADVILVERDDISDALEAELIIFRDRVEHALLGAGEPDHAAAHT
jgi:hypothetical protein